VRYSIFDSAVDRKLEAKWLFPQEKATLFHLKTATCESKMLQHAGCVDAMALHFRATRENSGG
jgi:hypothetical protein